MEEPKKFFRFSIFIWREPVKRLYSKIVILKHLSNICYGALEAAVQRRS